MKEPLCSSAPLVPVSEYRRPAAGRYIDAEAIRDLDTLEHCVRHVLDCTLRHPCCSKSPELGARQRYSFVSDRLRAIRGELTLQGCFESSDENVLKRLVYMLERMINFRKLCFRELPSRISMALMYIHVMIVCCLLLCCVCTDAESCHRLRAYSIEVFDSALNDKMLFDCFSNLLRLCKIT